jgi:hypothetical protein
MNLIGRIDPSIDSKITVSTVTIPHLAQARRTTIDVFSHRQIPGKFVHLAVSTGDETKVRTTLLSNDPTLVI